MAFEVEPVVTLEKLRTLLAEQHEQPALDYKRTVNLGKGHAADTVELTKDVAAMQSEPNGGYIVVGADDQGSPVPDLTADLAKHFDEATLRPKLAQYLTDPQVRSAQHEIDGNVLVLVYIAPASHGFCIFHTNGEYEDPKDAKRKVVVFRIGDVFVRHGTSSVRWTDADRERLLDQIIERRKQAWRQEAAEEFAAQLTAANSVHALASAAAAVVSWNLDEADFENLVTELLRRNDDIPLRRLLVQAPRDAAELIAADSDTLTTLLDRITTLVALTIQYERLTWTGPALEVLEKIYALGFEAPIDRSAVSSWLDVITRVYGLGALAVRLERWSEVKLLADRRPWTSGPMAPIQGSWLRHALTMAARAEMVDEPGADLLARARNVIRSNAALRPDRPAEHEAILDSLCQFDVLGALVVIGEQLSARSSNFYTNFARYEPRRSAPAFRTILIQDGGIRASLFRGSDTFLADAIEEVSSAAEREALRFGGGWDGLEIVPDVEKFVKENRTIDGSP